MAPEGSSEAETDDSDPEFVEVDPIGRYGRYKEVLGKGAFKKVYRAFDELEGIEVAWNQVKVSELLRNSEDLERLYSEVHLLKTLKHKNIIKFYNSWIDTKNEHINFITEIFTSGTLRQYRKKHKHVDLRALKKWSKQILEGLLYLHSHDPPVIHRDLKCDNIFVNGNHGEVKIGDLGLAAILHHANAAHSVIGTPEFMAPELYEEEYNELVDIYAFGMCLLELVTFEYPYTECSNAAQIYRKVTTGIKPASLTKVIDPTVKAFIEKCIAHLPERLSAKDLLDDPFLSDVNPEGKGHSSHINVEHKEVNANQSDVGRSRFEDWHTKSNISHLEECQPGPNKDVSVQGERKDINTIFIKLKIVDSTGLCHNIHFPFDIEADTSIAVASEMVHELETDQDIPTIADMIDSEIRALIPEWSPRDSSTGESAFDSHVSDTKDDASPVPLSDNKDNISPMTNLSSFSGSSFFPDQLPSGRKFWSDSPRVGGELSPIISSPISPSDVHATTPGGQTCRTAHHPSKSMSSNLHETTHEDMTSILSTPRKNSVETFEGQVSKLRSKDESNEAKKVSGDSNTESNEVIITAKKLDQLLHVQQKELDELKRKHNLVVFDFFKELSPQVRLKVFNMCREKTQDHKLNTMMDLFSLDDTSSDTCELSSDNGCGVSAKRIFTRSVSTIDLTICPRISSDGSIKGGTPREGSERPSGSLKGFKKESLSDGIAVILTDDAKESQSWMNSDD